MATHSKTIDGRSERDPRILSGETWRDSDGYWLPLTTGYRCALSDCHTIHELTVREVLIAIRNIEVCDCNDCNENGV